MNANGQSVELIFSYILFLKVTGLALHHRLFEKYKKVFEVNPLIKIRKNFRVSLFFQKDDVFRSFLEKIHKNPYYFGVL